MSGGDSAIVSPVERTRTPASKHLRNVSESAGARRAGARLELDAADHADVSHVVDHVRRSAK
jgi:hypothetical protein